MQEPIPLWRALLVFFTAMAVYFVSRRTEAPITISVRENCPQRRDGEPAVKEDVSFCWAQWQKFKFSVYARFAREIALILFPRPTLSYYDIETNPGETTYIPRISWYSFCNTNVKNAKQKQA